MFCTEAFFVYKSSQTVLNYPGKPCSDTHDEPDFGKCLKIGVERKINCTIPDMMSGTPLEPEEDLKRPLCTTPEQFKSYRELFEQIGFSSEGVIHDDFGCLPKCKENENECTWY